MACLQGRTPLCQAADRDRSKEVAALLRRYGGHGQAAWKPGKDPRQPDNRSEYEQYGLFA